MKKILVIVLATLVVINTAGMIYLATKTQAQVSSQQIEQLNMVCGKAQCANYCYSITK